MNVYAVRVYVLGIQQGGPLFAEARSASEAMDMVEEQLGLKPPSATIDVKTGKMSVSKWHGRSFRARRIR
jgi:hypothetical protein